MKPFLVRIDENPSEVLKAFSDEELLMELVLRCQETATTVGEGLVVTYKVPITEYIIPVGIDNVVFLHVDKETEEVLKEIACLN